MDSEVRPVGEDEVGSRALEVSALRDEIEILKGRVNSTAGAGVVITALFAAGSAFMERPGALWFLAALWLLFIARLGVINRTSALELRLKETELRLLTGVARDPALPGKS